MTIMVDPPGWLILPVCISALPDRGAIFDAAALAMMLASMTVVVPVALPRVPNRVSGR